MLKITIQPDDVGKRTDVLAAEHLPSHSRSSLEPVFTSGKAKVNGKPAKAGYKLKLGDELEVDHKLLKPTHKKIDLPIIYEDNDVIVINKPAGILTHSKGLLNIEATVASFIHPKLNDKKLEGNRAGIVHRLDRPTSGVIVTARNAKAMKWLQKQFSTRKARKVYLAVVEGVPKPDKAIIDAPIGRNPVKPQTFKVASFGRPAVTEYRTIKTFEYKGRLVSLVEFRPKTGRTHQIRVHAAYTGHPLIGDPLYGSDRGKLYLHAKSLELTLPNGQDRTFEAKLPQKFAELIK